MKTINAKRIAAVAASLLMGLAFAGTGGVTWSNIPIINNQGQPVVQIVVGSTAQPSDGVVAANIAAVLGNLAFTSVNVTATPGGLSNVHCVVTTPTCTLTNQQVWFNEHGFSAPSGSYSFTALIGSVFNAGLTLGSPSNTKSLATSSSYGYPVTSTVALALSPQTSPYSGGPTPPYSQTVTASTNGGGMSSSGFGGTGFRSGQIDSMLEVTNSQLPALLNNWGSYGESSQLWITGEPVFDQASGVNNFAVFDAGGAYQVLFNKPIPYRTAGNAINNANIQFLGKNWTVLNYQLPGTSKWNSAVSATASASSSNAVLGGALSLAASLTPVQTIYVGHNVSSGGFTVSLTDLGQPNSGGTSQASINLYYNGTLTNTTQISPGNTTKFQVGSHTVYVKVNQTFAGLYAYQKWAKMQLYSNVFNITDNAALNTTNANGWTARLWWTNSTGSAGIDNELSSIVIYNTTPSSNPLLPGQSFTFVTPNMTNWKVSFVGSTLGNNFDPATFALSTTTTGYANNGAINGVHTPLANLTQQPTPELVVSSQIPNAFSYAGQVGGQLVYNLEPYQVQQVANGVASNGMTSGGSGVNKAVVTLTSTNGDANVVTATNPLTVTVTGYTTSTFAGGSSNTLSTNSVTFYGLPSGTNSIGLGENLYNVTNIYLSRVVPLVNANVVNYGTGIAGAANAIGNTMAVLSVQSPQLMYIQTSGQSNYHLTSGSTVSYNQQNGQPTETFSLSPVTPSSIFGSHQYFTYALTENAVPGSTSTSDMLEIGVFNNTAGIGTSPYFQLNTSLSNNRNNLTYVSSQSNQVNAPVGFYTERGTKVASISPSSVTLDLAKAVDTLQFVVGPTSGTSSNATSLTTQVGPVGVGQAVPGFANLTVSKVNATCAFSSTSCSVSGLSNLTATPSVTSAITPVAGGLNTATTPLAVLDSNANSASTLIVVGSKYVNSVAAQIFAQNSALNASFGPGSAPVVSAEGTNRILVAGYSANQTVQAGNQFINDLLQAAGSV
ncbi:MAG: S-layer protein [Candidatus Micrarchaeota archaeon]|nr:S-layer protein [Candidatus Micrarchaeota archaeon]MDE1834250.1 S-layer protein [Candidatus Micrarchaeota archaeon]MDE1858922.1 S-layer protein [Candidatus Micrarchaeota archaeon]